ncbi:MAG TPA: hypothetical protein VFU59_04085, partial [Candidatus Eisenbacteria bacterium]|nr:hypothetical protein [Candidatus Eisenbacteria bacterium]
IANAVGEMLRAAPQSVWVRLEMIPATHYAENGGTQDGAAPIFVTLLEKSPPEGAALVAEISALTTAIAAACDRDPTCVHLVYELPGRGRVSFGGRLVT